MPCQNQRLLRRQLETTIVRMIQTLIDEANTAELRLADHNLREAKGAIAAHFDAVGIEPGWVDDR